MVSSTKSAGTPSLNAEEGAPGTLQATAFAAGPSVLHSRPVASLCAAHDALRERLNRANVSLCSNIVFAGSAETALERADIVTLFEILEEMVCDALTDLDDAERAAALLAAADRAEVLQ